MLGASAGHASGPPAPRFKAAKAKLYSCPGTAAAIPLRCSLLPTLRCLHALFSPVPSHPQLRITYAYATAGAAPAADAAAADAPGSDLLGRRLCIPLRFSIQPTLRISALRFLELGVPMVGGRRAAAAPRVNLRCVCKGWQWGVCVACLWVTATH